MFGSNTDWPLLRFLDYDRPSICRTPAGVRQESLGAFAVRLPHSTESGTVECCQGALKQGIRRQSFRKECRMTREKKNGWLHCWERVTYSNRVSRRCQKKRECCAVTFSCCFPVWDFFVVKVHPGQTQGAFDFVMVEDQNHPAGTQTPQQINQRLKNASGSPTGTSNDTWVQRYRIPWEETVGNLDLVPVLQVRLPQRPGNTQAKPPATCRLRSLDIVVSQHVRLFQKTGWSYTSMIELVHVLTIEFILHNYILYTQPLRQLAILECNSHLGIWLWGWLFSWKLFYG